MLLKLIWSLLISRRVWVNWISFKIRPQFTYIIRWYLCIWWTADLEEGGGLTCSNRCWKSKVCIYMWWAVCNYKFIKILCVRKSYFDYLIVLCFSNMLDCLIPLTLQIEEWYLTKQHMFKQWLFVCVFLRSCWIY